MNSYLTNAGTLIIDSPEDVCDVNQMMVFIEAECKKFGKDSKQIKHIITWGKQIAIHF